MARKKLALVPTDRVSVGARLITDDGFTCIGKGVTRIVKKDAKGLYVSCGNGKHYLDGQISSNGKHYVGFFKAPARLRI